MDHQCLRSAPGWVLLVGGRATDLFDRKRVFLLGLGLFSAASLLGGLAPSLPVILFARGAQGLGAALLYPSALALLTTTFPEGEVRNRALGIFGSVASIGFSLGVILGGVLTSLLSWRWVFFVNVPLGLLLMVGAWLLLPSSRPGDGRKPLDLIGAILFTGAATLLVLTFSQLGSSGAGFFQILTFFLLTFVLVAVFIFVERRASHPLVPLAVIAHRNLSLANLLGALTFALGSLFAFVLTLYLQKVLGLSALLTGLVFLPAGIGGMIGGQVAAAAIRWRGLRFASMLGPALIAFGCLLMVQITPVEGVVWVAVGYMIVGVGIVCMTVSATIAATAGLGPEFQGLAAGSFNTSQNVGEAVGISLASVAVTSVALAASGSVSVAATAGDRAALYLALGLTVPAIILALAMRTKAVAGGAEPKKGAEPFTDRRPEKSSSL